MVFNLPAGRQVGPSVALLPARSVQAGIQLLDDDWLYRSVMKNSATGSANMMEVFLHKQSLKYRYKSIE